MTVSRIPTVLEYSMVKSLPAAFVTSLCFVGDPSASLRLSTFALFLTHKFFNIATKACSFALRRIPSSKRPASSDLSSALEERALPLPLPSSSSLSLKDAQALLPLLVPLPKLNPTLLKRCGLKCCSALWSAGASRRRAALFASTSAGLFGALHLLVPSEASPATRAGPCLRAAARGTLATLCPRHGEVTARCRPGTSSST